MEGLSWSDASLEGRRHQVVDEREGSVRPPLTSPAIRLAVAAAGKLVLGGIPDHDEESPPVSEAHPFDRALDAIWCSLAHRRLLKCCYRQGRR